MSESGSRKGIWVSDLNHLPEVQTQFRYDKTVHFYDTTLRAGEQAIGAVLDPDQKLQIARALDDMGVERIEVGPPKGSPDDALAIQQIQQAGLNAEVWGFSRAATEDIAQLDQLGVKSLVIEALSSDVQLRACGLSREEVFRRAIHAVSFAKDRDIKVAFFVLDGTRTEPDFLKEIYDGVMEAGAHELGIVDTLGVCGPEAIGLLIEGLRVWFGKSVPLHYHGHNDFGLATACAIAAVKAGADWIQGTINGMGDRAGGADIGEVALALSCLYHVEVALDLKKIRGVSGLVRELSGFPLAPWKPLVGDNLFVRESGADARQFHIPEAIEPYSADLVAAERRIVIGKKSGLSSITLKCHELGLEEGAIVRPELLDRVKQLAIEKRRLLTDEEFRRLFEELANTAAAVGAPGS